MLLSSEWTTAMIITTTSIDKVHSSGKSSWFACWVLFRNSYPHQCQAPHSRWHIFFFNLSIKHVILTTFDKTLEGNIFNVLLCAQANDTTRRYLIYTLYWIKAWTLKSQIGCHPFRQSIGLHSLAHLLISLQNNFFTWWKKEKSETERKRVRRWWDLQQCLTVRNSVVYINCNLFHSLSGPEEPCVCMCAWEKESVSVYMPVHMCISPCVCMCAIICAAHVCAWERGLWAELN